MDASAAVWSGCVGAVGAAGAEGSGALAQPLADWILPTTPVILAFSTRMRVTSRSEMMASTARPSRISLRCAAPELTLAAARSRTAADCQACLFILFNLREADQVLPAALVAKGGLVSLGHWWRVLAIDLGMQQAG